MSQIVAPRGLLVVFLMSMGIATGHGSSMVVASLVASLLAGHLLVRGALLAEQLDTRRALFQAGCLWFALNLVPVLVAVLQPEPRPIWPSALKSFSWMMLLTLAMLAGATTGPRASARRLLGILTAVFGLVAGSALLLAPVDGVAACRGGGCLKPLAGYSVMLLAALEREGIVVHVPALPGP
jgi:hypothetical protein